MLTLSKISAFVSIVILGICCNTPTGNTTISNDSTGTDTKTPDTQNKGVIIDPALPPIKTIPDTSFHLVFNGTEEETIHGQLGMKGPDIIIHFTINKPQTLVATIIPDKSDCNIRFTQIIMPREKSDGPFARELRYKLPTKGDYRLVIGHNMMAGDPEICAFDLKAKLE